MGVDAIVLSVTPEPTEDQVRELRERMENLGLAYEFTFTAEEFMLPEPSSALHWRGGSRFWIPGYERGNWPNISAAMSAMRAVFGNVWYGSDHGMYVHPFTDADWIEYWEHWRSSKWNEYWSKS